NGRFRSQTARLLLRYTGVTPLRRKTTRSLAALNHLWPGPLQTCSLWSRTPRNMLRRADGGSVISTSATANLPKRRWLTPAIPATRPTKIGTWSSLDMRLNLQHAARFLLVRHRHRRREPRPLRRQHLLPRQHTRAVLDSVHRVRTGLEGQGGEAPINTESHVSHQHHFTGDDHESHGHRHAEAPHAGTAAEIPAGRSPGNAPTLPRRQDGAILAPGQRGRRHLPDERGLCG